MVVGSMIGSGVFLLPRRFGTETGVLGAIIAWTIAGTGMLMLAFVFQRLATRKPDLDAEIFAYAMAGFGDYVGFNSAIGYWASACAGNTSYWVLITATMSAVVPAFGAGDTLLAVVVALAAVLESIVGHWGSTFIRIGVIVSVLGAYLAWTLMPAEVLYIPATTDDMPRFMARTKSHGAPVTALIMAAGLISLLLVALLFAADALDFMLDLTATRETYGDGKPLVPDMVIAAVATVYTLFLINAAGVDKLLLSCILYVPAAALYFKARRERGLRVFRPAEAVLFGVIVLGAVAGVVSLATGAIEI